MPNTETQHLVDLLWRIARRMKCSIKEQDPQIGVNSSQIHALYFIQETKGALMREIAEHLSIRPPSATSLIADLERLGFVRRSQDPKDKRAFRITMTKKGEYFIAHRLQLYAKNLERMITRLSPAERTCFIKALNTMISTPEHTNV
jgi:DNA-binding MarR family transcriptional regulator